MNGEHSLQSLANHLPPLLTPCISSSHTQSKHCHSPPFFWGTPSTHDQGSFLARSPLADPWRAGSLVPGKKRPPVVPLASAPRVSPREGGSSSLCSREQWLRIGVGCFCFFPYEEKISLPYQTRMTIYSKLYSEFIVWNERKWSSMETRPN